MRGILPCFASLQYGQHGGRVALAVVGHLDGQHAVRRIRPDGDMHGDCIVADSVVQKVFDGPQQQGFVRLHHRVFCRLGQFQFKGAVTCGGAFVKFGSTPAQERADRHSLAAQRLCAVLQLAGQVQIADERPYLLALGADARGFLPGYGRQGLILLHPAKALPVLQANGLPTAAVGEDNTIALPPLRDDLLAGLVQALADSGAGVVGLTQHTRTLEEIFLTLTAPKEVG